VSTSVSSDCPVNSIQRFEKNQARMRSTPKVVAEDRPQRGSSIPLSFRPLGREHSRPPEDSRKDRGSGLLDLDLAVESFSRYSVEYAARESREHNWASLAVKEASLTYEEEKAVANKLRLPKESSRAEGISLSLARNAKRTGNKSRPVASKRPETGNKSRPAASRRPAAEKHSSNPLPSKHLGRENYPRSREDSREDKDSALLDSGLLNLDLAVEPFTSCFSENAPQRDGNYHEL